MVVMLFFFFFKQKTAYEMRISDWSSDVCSSDLGNFDSMCVGCHLAPGMAETELSNGLYPAPPSLAEAGLYGDPAKTFWVIKHGIKATGKIGRASCRERVCQYV